MASTPTPLPENSSSFWKAQDRSSPRYGDQVQAHTRGYTSAGLFIAFSTFVRSPSRSFQLGARRLTELS